MNTANSISTKLLAWLSRLTKNNLSGVKAHLLNIYDDYCGATVI